MRVASGFAPRLRPEVRVSSIEDKRKARAAFMNHLYDAGDGSELFYESYQAIGSLAGIEDGETALEVARFLVSEGLAQWVAIGGIGITHQGVVEVERSRTSPDEPTEHLAPFNNVNIILGPIHNSQIQQGTVGSFQLNQPTEELREIMGQVVADYRERLEDFDLADDQRIDAEARLATLQAEISSPDPRRPIIAASLQTLWEIALAAGGSVAAQAILHHWSLLGVR